MRDPNPYWLVCDTRERRGVNWRLWHSPSGTQLYVATLSTLDMATVLETAQAGKDAQVMLLDLQHRSARLRLYRSASAGYYDRHPEQRFPGCTFDLEFEGTPAQLYPLDAFAPAHQEPQRSLWGA